MARVWHEGAVIRQAKAKRVSKNIIEQHKVRADDGNRTRMTSLEVRALGPVGDLRDDRPGHPMGVSVRVTAVDRRALWRVARVWHALGCSAGSALSPAGPFDP